MKLLHYFLVLTLLLCVNLFAQQVITKSDMKKNIQTYQIESDSPNGGPGGPYLPLEGFEGEFFPPEDWELYNYYWSQTSYSFHNGTNSAGILGEPYMEDWLISPEFDLIIGTNPFLTYWEYVEIDQGLTGEHYVMISTDYDGEGDPYNATWTTLRTSITEIYSWDLREIDLNSYEGQSVHIAFYYVGVQDDNDYGSSWFVDDVLVDDFCAGGLPVPNCATVNSPPDGATLYQNFISFWWSPPFTNVTEQSIRIWKVVNGVDEVFYEAELGHNTIGLGPFGNLLDNNTTYYWQVIPSNCSFTAQNCPIWSFTTNEGEYNYGGGDVTQGGYYFANSTLAASGAPAQPEYNWIDISGTGTDIINSIGDDETIGPLSLGFTFNYFGVDYDSFYINSNGFITFESTTFYGTTSPPQMPHSGFIDNFITGYWTDLDPTNPNVTGKHLYYGMNSGDMVVTFDNYPEKNGDVNGWISFQIILKSNDNIKIQFNDMGASFDTTDGGVGIENSSGTQGITYRQRGMGGPIFSSPLALEFGTDQNLPVELSMFSASADHGKVLLNWSTENEVNNFGFEIERTQNFDQQSSANQQWNRLGFVEGSGNSNSTKNYEYVDKTINSGKFSYRLKQIDIDGATQYSNVVNVDLGLPVKFELNQNYPNPFNPSTKIKFQIPLLGGDERGGLVNLKVYDVLGNEVVTLVDEYRAAGSYEVEFQSTVGSLQLASGVYYYQLKVGSLSSGSGQGFVETKKMLLMK